MATREQLRKLDKSCGYLLMFDEETKSGHVETHSGSIQMFSPTCGFEKARIASSIAAVDVDGRAVGRQGGRKSAARHWSLPWGWCLLAVRRRPRGIFLLVLCLSYLRHETHTSVKPVRMRAIEVSLLVVSHTACKNELSTKSSTSQLSYCFLRIYKLVQR